MGDSIKSLIITGGAVTDMNKSRRPIGSRKKRSNKYEEDEEFIEQAKQFSSENASKDIPAFNLLAKPVIQPSILKPPTSQLPRPVAQSPVDLPKPLVQPPPVISINEKDPEYDGGARVILKPSKNPRVKLQPKGVVLASIPVVQTRKARKFRLTVGNLKHRFTRAKKVKDETEGKAIESIRSYLIGKGVIQEKSKAPERMLRSMYRDFMLLRDTAL